MGANAQTSVPAFTAGQVLTAAQMTQVNTGIPVFASSTERDAAFGGAGEKTLAEGQLAYLEDTNETQVYDGSAWVGVGANKILQVVRATDSLRRNTTSTSYVDANISVTITPTSASNDILLVWSFTASSENSGATDTRSNYQITDTSNVAIAGAERSLAGLDNTTVKNFYQMTMLAYDSPATTSATTYKGRFNVNGSNMTNTIYNDLMTGQLFALEISA